MPALAPQYDDAVVERFLRAFAGSPDAHWTGAREPVEGPPTPEEGERHLAGIGPGLAVAPLLADATCRLAAVDIDEPSLGAARALQRAIPGSSFVERSGGGNLHVWVFFTEPVEGYVASGVLAHTARATGVTVDVCPGLDEWSATSHIKLPYHGDSRPMLDNAGRPVPLVAFLDACERSRSDPAAWRESAQRLGLSPPKRDRGGRWRSLLRRLHV